MELEELLSEPFYCKNLIFDLRIIKSIQLFFSRTLEHNHCKTGGLWRSGWSSRELFSEQGENYFWTSGQMVSHPIIFSQKLKSGDIIGNI